nr:MAG TPA: NUMOD4 motif protein [Caudoviricetes sp.]
MEEIWKDVEGYEGLYQVSNFGRVRSLKSSMELVNVLDN